MSKNIIPILIIIAVIMLAGVGVYFLYNQKIGPSELNLNPPQNKPQTATPTNAIITSTPTQATGGANMDNYQTTADGLKILDEVVGTGAEVKAGDTVTVNYLGTLENGTKFDSSYDRNTPFTTQIGVGQVIQGWDEGIVGMKIGGKRKLIIPSSLGYGEQGAGDAIPPNAILVFEVELISIK